MLVQNPAHIEALYLFPHCLRLDVLGQPTPFMRFRDLPELRQALGEFLLELIGEHQHSWFAHECGRCGNSCRRPDILVREQEIFPIQMQLGLRQEQFRQRYLGPAQTWNELDGHLLHTPEGACPFLQGNQVGEPQASTCSIYNIRPRSCRELTANQSYCRKEPGHLLQLVASCWITSAQIVVKLDDGQRLRCATPAGAWPLLTQAIVDSPELEDRRLPEILESLIEVFDEEIRDFGPSQADQGYLALIERLYLVLRQAADLVQLGDEQEGPLEEAWRRYHHLQRLLARPGYAAAPAGAEKVRARLPWEALQVSESGLLARLPFGVEQKLVVDSLQEVHRRFARSILQTQDEVLQEALAPPEPECVLCGECCRRYSVEVVPSDVTRLSRFLEIPAQQFVDEYTEPGLFTWNLKGRILKKKSCHPYSRNLMELTVRGQTNDEECIFLDRKDDGLFYCRVHSHKPDVCRAYAPDNSLCRRGNHLENPGRQAENLVWAQLEPAQVRVQTRDRQQRNLGPLLLSRDDWPELDAAGTALEQACLNAWLETKG